MFVSFLVRTDCMMLLLDDFIGNVIVVFKEDFLVQRL